MLKILKILICSFLFFSVNGQNLVINNNNNQICIDLLKHKDFNSPLFEYHNIFKGTKEELKSFVFTMVYVFSIIEEHKVVNSSDYDLKFWFEKTNCVRIDLNDFKMYIFERDLNKILKYLENGN